jgi:hypothetical protein
MDLRTLMVGAVLATGLAGVAHNVRADIIAGMDGISVQQADVATPARGMTMGQVASKFGSPSTKVPAVGNPPISRWDYPGFVVYFERDHVIHTVVSSSAAPPAAAAAPTPPPAAPEPAEAESAPPAAAAPAPPTAAPAPAPAAIDASQPPQP